MHRHKQLVLPAILQFHELVLFESDANLLETNETRHAVVHVHDVVAHLEIAEIREERPGRTRAARTHPPLFVEHIRLGKELQPGIG